MGAELQQLLSAWPDLDAVVAARSAAGDETVLRRLLRTFARHYAAGVPVLHAPPDIPAWLAAAHSMQGACGAIGALTLQAQAQALEARLRRGEAAPTLTADAQALSDAVRALSARIATALPP